MRFSERLGLTKIKDKTQINSIDSDLRNSLWNLIKIFYFNEENYKFQEYKADFENLINLIWFNFLKEDLDKKSPNFLIVYGQIKDIFYNFAWYQVYDFIEFIVNIYSNEEINNSFISTCNNVLKRELSGYRFVGKTLTQITSEIEKEEIEKAINIRDPFGPVKIHLETALKFLSDKKTPDYRNSIKESISAIESMCKIITKEDKATLNLAIKILGDKIKIHPALKSAFDKIYGYTGDADGIRHALMDETDLDFEDARFMLLSCSAFVNYLKIKVNKAKIIK